jgi:outer membrane protein assembly factor BamB
VKFDRDGTLLWQQNLNGSANGFDEAFSVAVDNQGNVVAAGFTENTGTGFSDFTVVKFDPNGTLLWQQNLNGTANGFDRAQSMALDNQGNVVAAGLTANAATFLDFTVAKFDRDGTLLWRQNLNGTANDNEDARSVAVDNQGNVVAAGVTRNTGTFEDFTVAKFGR